MAAAGKYLGALSKRLLSAGGDVMRLFFPPVCRVCGRPLVEGEDLMCLGCDIALPRTNYHLDDDNPLFYKILGHTPIVRAASMFFYASHNPYSRLITDAKYNNQPEIVRKLAARYASELLACGFFNGVDAIVPVPMHWWKRFRRGYNQAEVIARSIGAVTGLPVVQLLTAASHSTQTRKNRFERMQNARNIYSYSGAYPSDCSLHILLVDDVITTGATTLACCEALHAACPDMRISVLSLAATTTR